MYSQQREAVAKVEVEGVGQEAEELMPVERVLSMKYQDRDNIHVPKIALLNKPHVFFV